MPQDVLQKSCRGTWCLNTWILLEPHGNPPGINQDRREEEDGTRCCFLSVGELRVRCSSDLSDVDWFWMCTPGPRFDFVFPRSRSSIISLCSRSRGPWDNTIGVKLFSCASVVLAYHLPACASALTNASIRWFLVHKLHELASCSLLISLTHSQQRG